MSYNTYCRRSCDEILQNKHHVRTPPPCTHTVVCMNTSNYKYAHMYEYIKLQIYTHVHARACATCVCVFACQCVCDNCVCKRDTIMGVSVCVHACVRVRMCACMHACMHAHTYTRTRARTHARTHARTQIAVIDVRSAGGAGRYQDALTNGPSLSCAYTCMSICVCTLDKCIGVCIDMQ